MTHLRLDDQAEAQPHVLHVALDHGPPVERELAPPVHVDLEAHVVRRAVVGAGLDAHEGLGVVLGDEAVRHLVYFDVSRVGERADALEPPPQVRVLRRAHHVPK